MNSNQTTEAQVAELASLVAPYLEAAIERFGSLEEALPKLIALMADRNARGLAV